MLNDNSFGIDQVRQETRKLLEPLNREISALQTQVNSVNFTVAAASGQNFANIVNIINNSQPEWSKKGYLAADVATDDPADDNHECYNWYRILRGATNELFADSARALKSSGHSTFAANEGAASAGEDIPRWARADGWIEIGGASAADGGSDDNYDLYIPIPNDVVIAGQTFYFQFEAQVREGVLPADFKYSVGFYDNSPLRRRYIEGGNFTISGNIFGAVGTRNVEYKVLAKTDTGEEALSNTLAFANAPNVFTPTNHPRINLNGAPGFTRFEIYRRDVASSTFVLQFTVQNSIDTIYYDSGQTPQRTVTAFPVSTNLAPRAATTKTLIAGGAGGAGFLRNQATLFVPTTYDRSQTLAGMQYLRFGFPQLGAAARQILVRRFGLSQGDGLWARSSGDLAQGRSSPTSQPVTSPSGNTGGVEQPVPYGGNYCVLTDTICDTIANDVTRGKPLKSLVKGEYLDSGGLVHGRIRNVLKKNTQRIIVFETANGKRIGCSFEQPIPICAEDPHGTRAEKIYELFQKEEVLFFTKSSYFGDIIRSKLISAEIKYGDFEVGIPTLSGAKTFWGNDILLHNKEANQYYPEIY